MVGVGADREDRTCAMLVAFFPVEVHRQVWHARRKQSKRRMRFQYLFELDSTFFLIALTINKLEQVLLLKMEVTGIKPGPLSHEPQITPPAPDFDCFW